MRLSKRLRLAVTLAPLFGAVAFAIPAQAASTGGASGGHPFAGGARGFSGGARGDFHGGFRDHDRHHFGGFGFGFGFWDPWWGWDAGYWGYPYPYYYYPPYPAYYAPPPLPPAQAPVEATGAPPPQSWYFCDNPQGYYPYVQNCSSAWRQVTPPQQPGNTITPQQNQ